MAITVSGSTINSNSDWTLRSNTSTTVETIRNNYAQGNQNTPAFCYHGNGGWRYFSRSTWNVMDNGRMGTWNGFQRASGGYGFTNGRYYAPVTGYYYFHCDFYQYNNDGGTNNYTHMLFGRNNGNGWAVGGRTPYIIHGHGGPRGGAQYPHGPNISAVMRLTQGQYCNIRIYHNTSGQARYHGNHSFFCGHLLD